MLFRYMRFAQNSIFVFRNHIDGLFEPDMRRPFDIDFEIGKSYVELKQILDFIDIMKLDHVAEEAVIAEPAFEKPEED